MFDYTMFDYSMFDYSMFDYSMFDAFFRVVIPFIFQRMVLLLMSRKLSFKPRP